ncbi:unnamed protein product [Diabrotica balteata]|uniref:Mitochondrial folate transporter/carrier n=1 Tax=Diabrotica balteata TaxID=107213 RepID=A0A9N9XFK2_DIABA|nr:unnamed protein product [Diabrotica balteata]
MTLVTKKTTRESVSLLSQVKYEHLVAGLSGGITSTLVLHPLDVIKIRFAVNDGRLQSTPKYKGIANAFLTIFRQEGIRGLYQGVTPNVWGAGASWGLYFFFYDSMKNWLKEGNIDTKLSASTHLLVASQSGFMTLLLTNPVWVVKTRLCLQYAGHKKYDGMIDALIKIYQKEGFRGYYKGLVPGIFGVSHGAVQFMVYEELKKEYCSYSSLPLSTKLGTIEYLTFAATSKLIAAATTYPYQVIRARLQNQHYSYAGALDCIKQTWLYEGWKGFYKGLGTNLLRVIPATMITFVTYENVSYMLLNESNI